MSARNRIVAAVAMAMALGAAPQRHRVHVDFKDTTLENGLRVITVEDHSAPVVSLALTYNVGSRNERKGRTGFAHLFEHMMFKGSENVGTGEHMILVGNNGGTLNGSTSENRTNYFETLPANQLDLALFLESDRMRSLAITQENLDNQRNAVQEERRLRVDNVAYGKSDEILQDLMYDNFAFKHSTIGSMEDLNAASVEDVRAFFKLYYAPNNVVLALVGDFKTEQALAKIRHYFGAIPRQPDPPPVDPTEPEQTAERRATVNDPLARLPQVAIAFKTVPGNTPDFYALEVLSGVLQNGESSRLNRKLVKEKELVTSVRGFVQEMRGPSPFSVAATLRPDVKPEAVETAVYEEIARLQKEPITDRELQKAQNGLRRGLITSLQSSMARAQALGIDTVYYNDPGLINTRLDRITAVTKEDVQRVAGKYLRPSNRTVVITLPSDGGGSGLQ
jgi:predicted Zn-dependent peptidase